MKNRNNNEGLLTISVNVSRENHVGTIKINLDYKILFIMKEKILIPLWSGIIINEEYGGIDSRKFMKLVIILDLIMYHFMIDILVIVMLLIFMNAKNDSVRIEDNSINQNCDNIREELNDYRDSTKVFNDTINNDTFIEDIDKVLSINLYSKLLI
ncbi:hypothetical protein BCR32DRAFT_284300 [Anaeromyces robustus]|uniref:Uncharacterized protein n=1 Tax=Anaeromyces robustus TaxID=1754192 RepID=A0A1Y1WS82_9FUNG|nr:hypothetical protein BCR32DRAFT_284300 [Anaeromyces robustus]|eukprot:ORX76312.1 hypothetical protein BCR32DRAFT_284300 [Anaeromyces robustus]